jgi:hypothetical protein
LDSENVEPGGDRVVNTNGAAASGCIIFVNGRII